MYASPSGRRATLNSSRASAGKNAFDGKYNFQKRRSRVTPSACSPMPPTDHSYTAGRFLDRPGAVAGAVLRASRLSAGVGQAVLAARADVTEETVQSWEDGSSPLASVPFPQVETLIAALTATGANPAIVADLHAAAWCDLVIQAFAALEDTACLLADPITREAAFSELLAWHMADRVPARYQPYASPGRSAS